MISYQSLLFIAITMNDVVNFGSKFIDSYVQYNVKNILVESF